MPEVQNITDIEKQTAIMNQFMFSGLISGFFVNIFISYEKAKK
jgi:hypothetical protein